MCSSCFLPLSLLDWDVPDDIMVFPLLDWTNDECAVYFQNHCRTQLGPLYQKYGVSGCMYCPFYTDSTYRKILEESPDILDRFIDWERLLNRPALNGNRWLQDLKREVCGEETVRDTWYSCWDQFEYGPYGNRSCNLCEKHLKCPNENLVFTRKALGEDHPFCINFTLSKAVKDALKQRGFLDRIKADVVN